MVTASQGSPAIDTVAAASPSPRATSRGRAGGWRRRVPHWFAWTMLALALLAPLFANEVPLVARVDGVFRFPAFVDLVSTPPPGPADQSWKQWWARLPADSADFAVMPLWPYGPGETDPERINAGPCFAHPLGNDDTGRDVLARLVHGTTTAVGLGVVAVVLGGLVGVLLGALAGFRRGFVDVLVLRLIEVFLCFPGLLFLLTAAAFLGDSATGFVLVLAALSWTSFARIVRGELLSLRERDYVAAARGLGIGEWRILRHHLLPQLHSQIAVNAAFLVAGAVIAESTMAFLGLGPGAHLPSWGSVLQQGKANAHLGVWHLWVFPGLALVATVSCCHALADQLRQRDPG